jgi:hypothetical protein
MCGLNPRSRLVLAKLEATPGSDPGPTPGTDDLFVSMDSEGIKLGVTQVGNEPASPTGYELPAAIATIKPTATYRIPLYGKGLSTGNPVLPRWLSVILASCGHVNLNAGSPAGSAVIWTPDSIYPRTTAIGGAITAQKCTFTVYDYLARDGAITGGVGGGTKILQAMVGCRVSQARIVLTVGQWAFLEVDILGLSVQPVASTTDLSGADLDDVRTDFVRANAAQSQINFGASYGNAIAMQSQSTTWTIDFGATQEEGDTTSAGVATVGTRQALVTASLNPIQATANIDNLANAQFDQKDGAYSMAGSMTPEGRSVNIGYTLKVAAPAVQILFDYDTSGSVVRLPTTAKAVSADSTTPPISLTLS